MLSKVDGNDYNTQWLDEAPASSYTSQLKHRVKSSQAINKGQAVYVSSADGTNMIVSKASNASEATSSKTMGLLESTVSINGTANVITEGLLAGLDTTGANAAGDPVWLGTDGNLIYGLVSKPSAPAHLVFIGVVTRRNANNGEIFVKVQNGFELDELHDLSVKNASDGDMIKYVASTGLWTKIAATTTNITEGTNLYYTQARFDTAFAAKSTSNLTEGTNLYYTTARANSDFDTRLATKSTTNLTEGTNLYYTTARANSDFDTRLATKSTTNLAEGTNLYYTDARVGTYLTANSYATQSYVSTQINNLVSGAPGLLDTLDELAAALGDDANFATTVSTALSNRLRVDINNQGLTSTQQGNGRTNLGLGSLAVLSSVGNAQITDLAWSKVTGAPAFITGYTEVDTLASVTGRGATTSTPITVTASEGREVAVYMPSSYTTDDLVSGHEYGWYNDHWRLGMTRSGGAAGADFVVQWNAARRLSLTSGGNLTVTGTVTGSSLIKSGGTSAQFLMADGSVSTNPGWITGYTETDTLASVTGRGATTTSIITINKTGTLISHSGMGDAIGYNASYGTYIGSPVGGTYYIYANGQMNNNGSIVTLLHSGNYNSYSPTLTGSGASGTWGINITGSSASSTDALRIIFNDGPRDLSNRLPTTLARSVNWDFVTSGTIGGTGNYGGVMSFTPWSGTTASTGDSSYQLAFMNESGINGSGLPGLRIRKGIDTTWGSWYTLLHAGNYTSYSPSLTGSGASGSWGISITGSAASSPLLSASGSLTSQFGSGLIGYIYAISTSTAGIFSTSDNSNAIITINRHPGNYYSQLGFNSSGTMFYRSFNATEINTSQGWQTIITSSNYNSYSPTLTGGGASGTWGIRITGFANQGTARLYSTDSSYNYDAANPYFGYLTYDGTRWLFQVSPGTPAAVRVAYADSAGSASNSTQWDGYSLPTWTNWSSRGSVAIVVGQLSWKNYGNNHVIFDASQSTSPTGSGVNSTNPDVAWSASYPTLMGWNGSSTYGVRVDSARRADNVEGFGAASFYRNLGFGSGYPSWDLNTVEPDRSGFTYSNGAPYTGPFIHIGASGYGMQFNANYGNGELLAYRVRNGDNGTWSVWRRLIFDGGGFNFSSLSVNSNTVLHAGNYTSYTLPIGGSWYAVNLPGSRWGGYAVSGGEIVFGNGLPNAGQLGILVDGCYVAGENNGFWSLPSNNDWNGRRGMFWNGSQLDFTTNSPNSIFADISIVGAAHKYLYINPGNGYEAMVRYNGGSGSGWYAGKRTSGGINSTADFHFYAEAAGADVFGITAGGIAIASGDMRAPIFYDSNDTGYYVDSNNRTSLNTLTVNGGTNYFYGITYFETNNGGYSGDTNSAKLQAYSSSNNSAFMSFHKGGHYAVNFGLDADNVMRIGGWSAATNRWQLDMSGNNWVASSFRAPIFYDSNDTGYFLDPNSVSVLHTLINNAGWLEVRSNVASSNPTTESGLFFGWNKSGGNGEANIIVDGGANTGQFLFQRYNGGGSYTNIFQADIYGLTANSGTVGVFSDIRLKTNITNASPKLNDLMKLNVVNYDFVGEYSVLGKQLGFIAQEVEQIFPSLVKEQDTRQYDDQGNYIKGYQDTKILKVGMEFAMLVKAMQEQQLIIESLKSRIETLEQA